MLAKAYAAPITAANDAPHAVRDVYPNCQVRNDDARDSLGSTRQ
jgi:hypothetical protein